MQKQLDAEQAPKGGATPTGNELAKQKAAQAAAKLAEIDAREKAEAKIREQLERARRERESYCCGCCR